MRDASPVELEKYWNDQVQADISPQHRWECLGPFNLAGRVTSLVIHPEDPKKWFAGSAAGGVWMSRDAGESWKPAWSPFASQNIGAIAWKSSQKILIVATGEANMSGDAYPGN